MTVHSMQSRKSGCRAITGRALRCGRPRPAVNAPSSAGLAFRPAKRAVFLALLLAILAAGLASWPGAALAQPDPRPADEAAGEAADESGDAGLAAPASADSLDIDALRQEYLRLRDQLFRSRARAAAVASSMYSTRVQVDLRYQSGRFYSVTRATIRLDGANVYDDTSGAIATDAAPRFEGFVAPGRHVLSIRIEATGKDDERFTSVMEHSLTIQAPAGKDVTVVALARDSGDMAYSWQRKESGSYKLSLDVKVTTRARPQARSSAKP
jgi:hypothetical protein